MTSGRSTLSSVDNVGVSPTQEPLWVPRCGPRRSDSLDGEHHIGYTLATDLQAVYSASGLIGGGARRFEAEIRMDDSPVCDRRKPYNHVRPNKAPPSLTSWDVADQALPTRRNDASRNRFGETP